MCNETASAPTTQPREVRLAYTEDKVNVTYRGGMFGSNRPRGFIRKAGKVISGYVNFYIDGDAAFFPQGANAGIPYAS